MFVHDLVEIVLRFVAEFNRAAVKVPSFSAHDVFGLFHFSNSSSTMPTISAKNKNAKEGNYIHDNWTLF